MTDFDKLRETIERGGAARYHEAAAARGKLFARERIARLADEGSFTEVCALFGPSAAVGAYIPAFCDFTAMVDGNASMYLGSPRMVEMVVSEKTTLEEMGGARLHCTVSGSGHFLAATEQDALDAVRTYLSYLPQNWEQPPPAAEARPPKPADLREELVRRFAAARGKDRSSPRRRHGISPA